MEREAILDLAQEHMMIDNGSRWIATDDEVVDFAKAVASQFAEPSAMWAYAVSPPQGFIEYVANNYNGDVNFHDPEWHALRLWNAALRNAQPPSVNLEALRNVRRVLDGSQPKDIHGAIMAIDALLATPAAAPVLPVEQPSQPQDQSGSIRDER